MKNEILDVIYHVETIYYAVTAVIGFITGLLTKKKTGKKNV